MSSTPPRAEDPTSSSPVLVLLVDDDPSARRVGVRALDSSGFSVIVAHNGLEALDIYTARRDEIALVILDMTMPMLGGVDTFHRLCAICPSVRVILLSGYGQDYVADSFGSRGPIGYVQKPYRHTVLIDAVKRGLGQEA